MTQPNMRQYFACTRKRKFKTQEAGERELRRIAKTGKIIPPTANCYKCSYCSGWHLGHKREEKCQL